MSLYIVTLAEMKAELGLTDTTDDAVLTRWMNGLQDRFDSHLERTLLRAADVEEIHDGHGTWLFTKNFPVESVASVHISPDQTWDSSTLIDATQYVVNKPRGRLQLIGTGFGAFWPEGQQNIRVVYTGGYVACDGTPSATQTAMPEAIRRAFFLQLGFEWRNRTKLGVKSFGAQGVNVQVADAELLPEVKQALAPFRRIA